MKHPAIIAALAALGLLFVWGGLAAQRVSAHNSHPGLQFSIDIRDLNGCTTRVRDPTCTLPTGSTFTMQVYLDSMGEGVSQYAGFDIQVDHTGVTPNQDASDDDWPDCGFPASFYGAGFIALACAIGVPPAGPSSYIGRIGTNSFKCTQSGSVTLAHGLGKTDLVEAVGTTHTEVDSAETINIICGQVPPGQQGIVATATPGGPENNGVTPSGAHQNMTPATEGPTLEPTGAAKATATAAVKATATAKAGGAPSDDNGDDGGTAAWVWIVIVVGVAAAVLAAAGGGWWYVRSRGGGGAGAPPAGTP